MFQNLLFGLPPGVTAAIETYVNTVSWGNPILAVPFPVLISGAARDSGASPTTRLRTGLVMGQIAASGKWAQYSATATDGTQVAKGVLLFDLTMVDIAATNQDRQGVVMVAGPVIANNLIGLDALARAQLKQQGILFDDAIMGSGLYRWGDGTLREVAKTTSYTVVASDAGTLFTNTGASGAVTFTLPAIAAGLGPFEFLTVADQNVTVASAEGSNMVVLNNASASSVAFTTSSQKIGSHVRIFANAAGTKWLVSYLTPAASTSWTGSPFVTESAKTTNYTVLATDVCTLFTTTGASGAVTFTLPTIAANLGPFGFLNTVDQNMAVASAEGDNIVYLNDASADSLTFSTSSQKIGGYVVLNANAAGTKWYAECRSPSNTVTVAT